MITDGSPNTCTGYDTVQSAIDAANTAATGTPAVKTYVISVGSDETTTTWDSIAVGGGTAAAHNTGSSGQSAVLTALDTIRDSLKCP
jgi:hypothetical protein